MNQPSEQTSLNWRQAIQAAGRAWKPLVLYELLMSLVSAIALGPLILAFSHALIGVSGETVLGNWELIRFLLSPIGWLTLIVGLTVTLGLAFIEYSGLILIADAALRGEYLSIKSVLARIFRATPRLLALAAVQASLAILLALPFVALAAVGYWLLLTEADIYYYFTQRPPRFWLAVAIGTALAIGFTVSALWLFLRWAFGVPACVLADAPWPTALGISSRLMRGRTWRLLLVIGAWQFLKSVALVVAILGLDWINELVLSMFEGRLSSLVWSSVAVLLIDAVTLQLLAAFFAVGLAFVIAYEYEQSRRALSDLRIAMPADRAGASLPWPPWRTRAAIIAIAIIGPLASVVDAILLSREYVEHRPALVTAHRAGPKAAPENSLAGLRMAIEIGVDYAEIDVQLTADGEVVLLHDRDLRRVTGDPRDLRDLKLADLKDARLLLGGNPSDYGIPTLAEFIAECDGRIRLNIELKDYGHSQDLAQAVLNVLRENKLTDRTIVCCLQMPPLVEIRQSEPGLPVGIVLSISRGDVTRLPVNFLSLNQRAIRADIVRRAHQRGMEVHAWTVDDRQSALRLLDLGCDNLITGDPALIREVVDWYADLGQIERMLLRLRRWIRE